MKRLALLVALTLLLLSGCQFGGTSENLEYTAPMELGLSVGEEVPGTGIRYVGETASGADIVIDGQHAYKQRADSVDWKGAPVAGVNASFSGRVLWFTKSTCHIVGTMTLSIPKPAPQVVPNIPGSPVRFRAVVTYGVTKGARIPGTLVTYVGKADNGARLGGVEGYAYRKAGDSIVWQGKVRDGVYVVVNVRVVYYTSTTMQAAGTVEVVLAPAA